VGRSPAASRWTKDDPHLLQRRKDLFSIGGVYGRHFFYFNYHFSEDPLHDDIEKAKSLDHCRIVQAPVPEGIQDN
jgi:hypothetical protein